MVTIYRCKTKHDRKLFERIPELIHKNNQFYVPPFPGSVSKIFKPGAPFYRRADAVVAIAYRDEQPVGRIAAIENRAHNDYWNDRVGFFGFFDFIDDKQVSGTLFDFAVGELEARGLTSIRGPYSPTVNDEVGMLVEGFDTPPFVMMPFNPPYYLEHFDELGLGGTCDLLAFYMSSSEKPPERIEKIVARVKRTNGLVVRCVDLKNLDRDLQIIHELYNETLDRNYGFVPLELADLTEFAKEFKKIVAPEMVMIAEKAGIPIGFSLALPNINEFMMRVRSSPRWLRVVRFVWYLYTSNPKATRVAILGVRKQYRNLGLGVLFYYESLLRAKNRYVGGELSWVDASNQELIHGMAVLGAKPYKKYRIFERQIVPSA